MKADIVDIHHAANISSGFMYVLIIFSVALFVIGLILVLKYNKNK